MGLNVHLLALYLLPHSGDPGCACTGDVIYTNMPTQGPDAPIPNVQYFWEAFPSGSGSTDRTTYLFTYIDADPSRCTTFVFSRLLLSFSPRLCVSALVEDY